MPLLWFCYDWIISKSYCSSFKLISSNLHLKLNRITSSCCIETKKFRLIGLNKSLHQQKIKWRYILNVFDQKYLQNYSICNRSDLLVPRIIKMSLVRISICKLFLEYYIKHFVILYTLYTFPIMKTSIIITFCQGRKTYRRRFAAIPYS